MCTGLWRRVSAQYLDDRDASKAEILSQQKTRESNRSELITVFLAVASEDDNNSRGKRSDQSFRK
jgi:hypothetical protein